MPGDFGIAPVPGDPAGMRALAAVLASDADRIDTQAVGMSQAVKRMEFQGPAATRLRRRAVGWLTRTQVTATDLRDFSRLLAQEADHTEAAQRQRQATIARLRAEEEARAVRAARSSGGGGGR